MNLWPENLRRPCAPARYPCGAASVYHDPPTRSFDHSAELPRTRPPERAIALATHEMTAVRLEEAAADPALHKRVELRGCGEVGRVDGDFLVDQGGNFGLDQGVHAGHARGARLQLPVGGDLEA